MPAEKTSETAEQEEHSFADDAKLEFEEEHLDLEAEEFFEGEGDTSDKKEEENPQEEDSSDEGEGNFEKRYKDVQSSYTKSQQELKESLGELEELKGRLDRLGGLDQIEGYLAYLSNDPDVVQLLNQKRDNKIAGIDEASLSPEGKSALELVKKIVKAEIQEEVGNVRQSVDDKLDPYIEAQQDRNLAEIYDKMDQNYGEEWSDQLETIQELSKDWSDAKLAKLNYADVEDLYILSLRRDGKMDSFIEKHYKNNLNERKEKSTGRPKTTKTVTPPKGKPRNMFDAAKRAELKKSRG